MNKKISSLMKINSRTVNWLSMPESWRVVVRISFLFPFYIFKSSVQKFNFFSLFLLKTANNIFTWQIRMDIKKDWMEKRWNFLMLTRQELVRFSFFSKKIYLNIFYMHSCHSKNDLSLFLLMQTKMTCESFPSLWWWKLESNFD